VVFSGLTFLLLFLPLLLLLYFVCKDIRYRNAVLLVFSLIFYAWGEPVMVLLMLETTLVNYLAAFGITLAKTARNKKIFMLLGVCVSLAALVYYKYSAFFVNSFSGLFGLGFSMTERRLPIGISFYTFQVLTYTIDVYREKVRLQRNPFRLLLYVCCFPQLIAGPIVQYSDIETGLAKRQVSPDDFTGGMRRFALGLGKKVLLANICGAALEGFDLASGAALSVTGAWLSGFLYFLQIYFDFSAYSDMAIGLGRVLGFKYKENFEHPYISASPTEFWRRWHISLSSFFRDYVYIPLGGSRRGKLRNVLNLFVVWLLTGLWHGAGLNFIIWGMFWFALLMIDRSIPKAVKERLPRVFGSVVTCVLALVGWVIFYYTDLGLLGNHLAAMIGLNGAALIDDTAVKVLKEYALFLPLAMILALPIIDFFKKLLSRNRKLARAGYLVGTVLLSAIVLLSLCFLVGQSYNPFIYFRF